MGLLTALVVLRCEWKLSGSHCVAPALAMTTLELYAGILALIRKFSFQEKNQKSKELRKNINYFFSALKLLSLFINALAALTSSIKS